MLDLWIYDVNCFIYMAHMNSDLIYVDITCCFFACGCNTHREMTAAVWMWLWYTLSTNSRCLNHNLVRHERESLWSRVCQVLLIMTSDALIMSRYSEQLALVRSAGCDSGLIRYLRCSVLIQCRSVGGVGIARHPPAPRAQHQSARCSRPPLSIPRLYAIRIRAPFRSNPRSRCGGMIKTLLGTGR